MPVRVAVTGRTQSPGLFETLRVIGNKRVQERVATAIDRLRNEGERAGDAGEPVESVPASA
jgi:hypothetical protein